MLDKRQVLEHYTAASYKWGEADCVTLINALLATEGYQPLDESFSKETYIQAVKKAIKDHGSMEHAYVNTMMAHEYIQGVIGALKPYDFVILNGTIDFIQGGMYDAGRLAVLGVMGPDYHMYAFKDVGLQAIKRPYPYTTALRIV